ncbi:MAG: PepSY domain-containing protein [Burkholderiales bacterium]
MTSTTKKTLMAISSSMFAFLGPLSASATGLPCSIHLTKDTPASNLPALAKVSMADAQKTALRTVKAPIGTVANGELEVEHGCLIYSFDIRVSNKQGIEEIMVDAGTGKVLSRKHESPKQEAAEQAKDKTKH